MAVRSIATTDTLETFRVEFNALAANDFGDITTLDPTLTATSVIGAVNELSAQVSATLGIFIEDATSSREAIGAGQTINVRGTSNQVNLTVSSPDTLLASLPNDVTIPNNLTVTNNLNTTGTSTLGSIQISGNAITVTDSSVLSFGSEALSTSGSITGGQMNASSVVSSGTVSGTDITASGTVTAADIYVNGTDILFEGTAENANELRLVATNPTSDRIITLPDRTGTVITTGDTGTVTSSMILNATILNEDIADTQIRAAKLNLSSDTLIVDTLQANTITGAASVASLVSLTANNSTNETVFLTFADGATGNQGLETDSDLTYNPSTNVLSTTASQANYADLAEYYSADQEYEPGTVLMFGGEQETTIATSGTNKVAGVVSTNPAYAMNGALLKNEGVITVAVALQGRVPCRVRGDIKKGDMMISGGDGVAIPAREPGLGTVIGKALENYNSQDEGVIEVVVGRL